MKRKCDEVHYIGALTLTAFPSDLALLYYVSRVTDWMKSPIVLSTQLRNENKNCLGNVI